MPSVLGKRKSPSSENGSDTVPDAHEILRRHFEARFKPLAVAPPPKKAPAHDGSEDDDSEASADQSESEWDGLSDDGDEDGDETGNGNDDADNHVVEVVDHTQTAETVTTAKMSKQELKVYLSSRPPSHTHASTSAAQAAANSKKTSSDEEQPEDSATLLANDLALQRLIAESHILSAAGANPSHWQSDHAASTGANTRTFAAGRIARKTTDMRLQALGAKESILTQTKMPMAMRKGIVSAAAAREEKRRREARENGIILEREVKKPKTKKKGRGERPVDMPAIGRMKGAELRVSAREARAIAASVAGPGGRGKGKRRR